MSFDESDYYSEQRILLKIEGDYQGYGITAYCGPDCERRTFLLDGDFELGNRPKEYLDAPFPIDIVFGADERPDAETMEAILDELGAEFEARFEEKVQDVYDIINDEDDPLSTIMSASETVANNDEFSVNAMEDDAE